LLNIRNKIMESHQWHKYTEMLPATSYILSQVS
jgi:hypothetical protein